MRVSSIVYRYRAALECDVAAPRNGNQDNQWIPRFTTPHQERARDSLEAEQMIAENFSNAAKTYEHTKGAIELRAMNLLYESMKTGSNTIVIPTHAANSIGLENPAAIAQAIAGIDAARHPAR